MPVRQEFVVGGFLRTKGAKSGIRALMLGVQERDGSLRFAGTAKPKLRPSQLTALQLKADALACKTSPSYNPPVPEKDRDYIWLEPRLVAEISFLEWTPAGEIRQPVFHGMRDDKPAASVTEEPVVDVEFGEPIPTQTGSTRIKPGIHSNATLFARVKVSNADRVINTVTGIKKIDLVRYYDEIAQWALPYIQDRPVWLVKLRPAFRANCFSRSTRSGRRFRALPGCRKSFIPTISRCWRSTCMKPWLASPR